MADHSERERFDRVYAERGDEYHALVMREDWQGNLLPAIRRAVALEGREVIELGAGTGRLTALVAPFVRGVRAFDRSAHMLERARRNLAGLPEGRVHLAVAENMAVPLPDASADIVLEGWSFGHSIVEAGGRWREAAGALLAETFRLLRPNGTALLIESLGTGRTAPAAPHDGLGRFYRLLEEALAFRSAWVRTDYRFASPVEADALTSLFFGATYPLEVASDGTAVLSECTGLWWRVRTPGLARAAAARLQR